MDFIAEMFFSDWRGTLALLFFALAYYIIGSYGLFVMAKNRGEYSAWLAFIPIGNFYLVGKMVGSMRLFGQNITNLAVLCPLASFVEGMLQKVPLIGGLLSLAVFVFFLMIIFNFFRQYSNSVPICVVCTLFLFIGFFALRNKPVIRQNFN